MTTWPRRFGITLAFLGIASALPATVGAQPPVYLAQWGTSGTGDGEFQFPTGIAVDGSGNVYVTDAGNSRVQKFSGSGVYLTQWGSLGNGDGQFDSPDGIGVDASGSVYVVDTSNNRVQVFTSNGTYLSQWGSFGTGNGQFAYPRALAVGPGGNIYVTDQNNARVEVFTNAGAYLGPVPVADRAPLREVRATAVKLLNAVVVQIYDIDIPAIHRHTIRADELPVPRSACAPLSKIRTAPGSSRIRREWPWAPVASSTSRIVPTTGSRSSAPTRLQRRPRAGDDSRASTADME